MTNKKVKNLKIPPIGSIVGSVKNCNSYIITLCIFVKGVSYEILLKNHLQNQLKNKL